MARRRVWLLALLAGALLVAGAAAELEGFGDEDDAAEEEAAERAAAAQRAAALRKQKTAQRAREQASAAAEAGNEGGEGGSSGDEGSSAPASAPSVKDAAAAAAARARSRPSSDGPMVLGGQKRAEEDWDEDEFANVPAEGYKPKGGAVSRLERRPARPRARRGPSRDWRDYKLECLGLAVLTTYAVQYFLGKSANEAIARRWAALFAGEGGVLERNFSLLGPAEEDSLESAATLMKDSHSEYKLYCSGRRFCESMTCTLQLKKRQDLLSILVGYVAPEEDLLKLEVVMNAGDMDALCFAVGTKKAARALHKADPLLARFTSALELPAEKRRRLGPDAPLVLAEASDVAADLVTEHALDAAFGKERWPAAKHLFRSMHFSSEGGVGAKEGAKTLKFEFVLPEGPEMQQLGAMIQLAMHYVDAVGRYRVSAAAAERIRASRQRLEKEKAKSAIEERRAELQKKKEEKRAAEVEAMRDMSREARLKKEEKEYRREVKKRANSKKIAIRM
mmetsp:Transcript_16567/g.56472  ORF Transcript_16567/g.56472 Transcript_16567/m.56472 type:complete len:507 (+) Transcript_16567:68-1588(+)